MWVDSMLEMMKSVISEICLGLVKKEYAHKYKYNLMKGFIYATSKHFAN